MFLDLIILILLVLTALWTVMTRSLLRASLGLALASAILTLIMFNMGASLAAVLELSVCAGLIPVLFISVISLTQPLTFKEALEHMHSRMARFWVLPLIVIILGVILVLISVKFKAPLPAAQTPDSARFVLWHLRQFDLLGQIIILFGGVFGVVVLFKERKKSA
ncbi:MAG: NADH-quinone oxidoreductase subunit J [Candidatus Omnitrophota bacterium]